MNTKPLKIKIALIFSVLIAIAFSLNWMVATQTMHEEKMEDLEKALNHLLSESNEEYINQPLTLKSDLSFLYTIPHNQMLVRNSEVTMLRFLVTKIPYIRQENEISTSFKLPNGLYLNAISDDTKLQLSVNKYAQKLLLRYLFSLLILLIITIVLLDYYMKPLAVLAQKTRDWKSGDPFDFSLQRSGREIEEVSNAFSALIHRIEGFRTKESELFKEAAHELKTPLALMRSRLDVYENSQHYEKAKFIADLGHDIKRLTDELQNVLFLESSDFEDPTLVNLTLILQPILQKVAILAQRKQLSISLSPHTFTLNTPEKLLIKALTALIENAMTYAPENSIITIHIDPLHKTLSVTNSSGGEKYLFSSKIGHKMLRRLSDELGFAYEIKTDEVHYTITLTFLQESESLL
ncbi:MAG: HAMP domain-containing sensor histidine kinase [Campylobacterales bacterium]|nr:HAMP domain-containing sensor histidine kinase [Campylobacterales bacterium]